MAKKPTAHAKRKVINKSFKKIAKSNPNLGKKAYRSVKKGVKKRR